MNAPDEEKRIIIDEDWKSQVQQEKARLQANQSAEAEPVETPPTDSADQPMGSLPPASFELLVTSLATQAFASLGQIPDPIDHKLRHEPALAKHHIDTLEMLEEKTRGNLSADESQLLSAILHQLRLTYVALGN